MCANYSCYENGRALSQNLWIVLKMHACIQVVLFNAYLVTYFCGRTNKQVRCPTLASVLRAKLVKTIQM